MVSPSVVAAKPKAFSPRLLILLAVTVIAAAAVYLQGPIEQRDAYHHFAADGRSWLGIPNFQNVVSNLPFLIVGLIGLFRLRRRVAAPGGDLEVGEKAAWILLFLGITLTAFGSSWYHLDPDNATLVWDRLPMTLGFMGFFAGVIGERISQRAYRLLLWPLAGLGVASVVYWHLGNLQHEGHGDLRLYALVQYLPLVLIPLMMVLYRPSYSHGGLVFGGLGLYAAAKALEYWDAQIFAASGGTVGGHALKHLVAAAGCWVLVRMFSIRVRK